MSAQTYDASDSDHEVEPIVDENVDENVDEIVDENVDENAIVEMVKERKVTYKSLVILLFKQNAGLMRETLDQVKPKVVRVVKNPLSPEKKAAAKQARDIRKEHFDAFILTHTKDEIAAEKKRYTAELRKNRRELKKRIADRKADDLDLDEPPGIAI
jgi:hypothetical protein